MGPQFSVKFIDAIFGHSLGPGVSTRIGTQSPEARANGESRNVTQYSKRENVKTWTPADELVLREADDGVQLK